MTAHTPGPWAVFGRAGYAGHKVGDCTGRSVAAFPATSKRSEDERNANAGLIAAAPDMLDLARNVAGLDAAYLDHIDHHSILHGILISAVREWQEQARAAIAKAEGAS
jgi:hypothetical protein